MNGGLSPVCVFSSPLVRVRNTVHAGCRRLHRGGGATYEEATNPEPTPAAASRWCSAGRTCTNKPTFLEDPPHARAGRGAPNFSNQPHPTWPSPPSRGLPDGALPAQTRPSATRRRCAGAAPRGRKHKPPAGHADTRPVGPFLHTRKQSHQPADTRTRAHTHTQTNHPPSPRHAPRRAHKPQNARGRARKKKQKKKKSGLEPESLG